jgi:hypothetical protein
MSIAKESHCAVEGGYCLETRSKEGVTKAEIWDVCTLLGKGKCVHSVTCDDHKVGSKAIWFEFYNNKEKYGK